MVISKSLVTSDLLFNDEDGIACLTNVEIFKNLALMGYEQISTKLTFQRGSFSPQWKFLIHTILHCISSKSTAWNEFSINLASAVICLAKGQKFNFSKLIFDGMLRNMDSKKVLMYPRRAKKVTKLPYTSVPLDLGADEVVHKEGGDNVERTITTDASLVTSQDSDNITKTQSMEISNDLISQEISSGDRPRRQQTTSGVQMLKLDDLMNFVPPTPYDSPLSEGHTPRSDEGRPNLLKLVNTCTQLSNRVLALEEVQTTQDKVITRLKLRIMRLKKKRKARTSQPIKKRLLKGRIETSTDKILGEDASKQGMNNDKTEELNLTGRADTEVIVKDKGSGEKTLIKLRSEKAKVKGVTFIDVEEPPKLTRSTKTLQPLPTINPKDKGKGVLVEEEPEKLEKVKRRDQGLAQIESDADLAQIIYEEELAELDKAQKEKQNQEEATIAVLTKEFDEIQARIDANHELAVRMTHEENVKYTIKEMARLLAEYFKKRKKQWAAERAEAIRNKPPTRT
nr:hypothetical protein [Tanacetum cinerariifolium]